MTVIPIYSDGSEESIQAAEDQLIKMSRSDDPEERIQGIIGLGTFRAICFLTDGFKRTDPPDPSVIMAALNMTAGLYSNIMELVPPQWRPLLSTVFDKDVRAHDKERRKAHDVHYKEGK